MGPHTQIRSAMIIGCQLIGYVVGSGLAVIATMKWIDVHVKTHPVASAFGYEYLIGAIPLLVALISFPVMPWVLSLLARNVLKRIDLKTYSVPVLLGALVCYVAALVFGGLLFVWWRQIVNN